VIDRQLQELNNKFIEVRSELLICVASLNPRDLFFVFDKEKLVNFTRFYPSKFSSFELTGADNHFMDVCSCEHFSNLDGISDLSRMKVETRKNITYPMLYLLLKLTLLLPVAIATVERVSLLLILSRIKCAIVWEMFGNIH